MGLRRIIGKRLRALSSWLGEVADRWAPRPPFHPSMLSLALDKHATLNLLDPNPDIAPELSEYLRERLEQLAEMASITRRAI